MTDRDREHRRTVLLVVEVDVEGLHRRSPAHAGADQRAGENLADVALLDQVMHVSHRRRRASLQTRHGEHALLLRQRGHGLRLLQAVTERPLAVHGLARLERRSRQFQVIRHFHGYRDDVHARAVHELLVIVERLRHAEELAGRVGGFASRRRQRRDLEVI